MRIPIILAFVALALSGCNANQPINPPDKRAVVRVIPAAIHTIPPATRRTTLASAAKSGHARRPDGAEKRLSESITNVPISARAVKRLLLPVALTAR